MKKSILLLALLGAVGAAAARRAIPSDTARAPMPLPTRRTAEVGGIAMSWIEQGEGTPLILLHGIPTSPDLWRHVIPRLTDVRVLAWEMVGYGNSIAQGERRDISVAQQAEYLVKWMDHLGIESAIFAGHDLGGGVAQIAAVRHRDRCSGLFLTNAIGYDSWPIPSVSAMKASSGLVRHLPDPAFKAMLLSLLYRGHDDRDAALEAFHVHSEKYLSAGGAAAMIRQIEHLDVNDTLQIAGELPSLSMPARLVWGAADQFQKIEYGERFSRELKAPLRRIAGGKHFTPEDHPEIVAEEIMKLVRQVEALPSAGA